MASGLKPMSFELGPLEPLAQVRLFLQRAPRPLRHAELDSSSQAPPDSVLQPPRRPVEFLRLSETPLFEKLGGNPSQLVDAAARLGLVPPAVSEPSRTFAAD